MGVTCRQEKVCSSKNPVRKKNGLQSFTELQPRTRGIRPSSRSSLLLQGGTTTCKGRTTVMRGWQATTFAKIAFLIFFFSSTILLNAVFVVNAGTIWLDGKESPPLATPPLSSPSLIALPPSKPFQSSPANLMITSLIKMEQEMPTTEGELFELPMKFDAGHPVVDCNISDENTNGCPRRGHDKFWHRETWHESLVLGDPITSEVMSSSSEPNERPRHFPSSYGSCDHRGPGECHVETRTTSLEEEPRNDETFELIDENLTIMNVTRWEHRRIILRGNLHLEENATLIMNNATLLFQRPPREGTWSTTKTMMHDGNSVKLPLPPLPWGTLPWWSMTADPNTTFIMDNGSYLGVVEPPHWEDPNGNYIFRWFDAYHVFFNGTRVWLRRSEVNSVGYLPFGHADDLTSFYGRFIVANSPEVRVEETNFTETRGLRLINSSTLVVVRSRFVNRYNVMTTSSGLSLLPMRNDQHAQQNVTMIIVNNTFELMKWGIGYFTPTHPPAIVVRALIADNFFNFTIYGVQLVNYRSRPNATLIFRNTFLNIYEDVAINLWATTENVTIWNNQFHAYRGGSDWWRGSGVSFWSSMEWPDFTGYRNIVVKDNLFNQTFNGVGAAGEVLKGLVISGNWFVENIVPVAIDRSDPYYNYTRPYGRVNPEVREMLMFNNSFFNNEIQHPPIFVYHPENVQLSLNGWGNYWHEYATRGDVQDQDDDGVLDEPFVIYDNGTPEDPSDDVVDPHPLARPVLIQWLSEYPSPWEAMVAELFPPPRSSSSSSSLPLGSTQRESDGTDVVFVRFEAWVIVGAILLVLTVPVIFARRRIKP